MKKLVTLLHCTALLMCCTSLLAQQDIYVNGKGPVLTAGTALVWGSSGQKAVNNYFIFSPAGSPNPQNMCVYIVNNNPTNSHTFTFNAFQTGDPSVRTYQPNSGRFTNATIVGAPSTVAAASTISAFIHFDAAATGVVQITGSASAGGSPDTADIYFVQTSSEHCGSGVSAQVAADQPGIINNQEATGVNSTVIVTINSTIGLRAHLYSVSAHCSAGTASLNVTDNGTTIWSTAATEVGTTTFRYQWVPGLASKSSAIFAVSLTPCGVSNTGTIDVQSSQY